MGCTRNSAGPTVHPRGDRRGVVRRCWPSIRFALLPVRQSGCPTRAAAWRIGPVARSAIGGRRGEVHGMSHWPKPCRGRTKGPQPAPDHGQRRRRGPVEAHDPCDRRCGTSLRYFTAVQPRRRPRPGRRQRAIVAPARSVGGGWGSGADVGDHYKAVRLPPGPRGLDPPGRRPRARTSPRPHA
jgi:hypothetical protein